MRFVDGPKNRPQQFSIASKVLIFGEYSVLAGGAAIAMALAPRFKLNLFHKSTMGFSTNQSMHSPAHRYYLKWRQENQGHAACYGWSFVDPFARQGGLGASSAEFALLYYALQKVTRPGSVVVWSRAWEIYRELTAEEPMPPSGVDMITQWCGGVIGMQRQGEVWQTPSRLTHHFEWGRRMVILRASHQNERKTPTHLHLRALAGWLGDPVKKREWQKLAVRLQEMVVRAFSAIQCQDEIGFGRILTEYANGLASAGLECSQTREDRKALMNVPGVVGVKGCGALGSDVLLAWMGTTDRKSAQADYKALRSVVRQRNLRYLVPRHLARDQHFVQVEDGIQWYSQ